MADAADGSTLDPREEELTPELALVDPELARRARERMAHAPLAPAEPPPAAVPPEDEPSPPVPRSRRRRVTRALTLATAALVAIALGVAVPPLLLEGRTSTSAPGAFEPPTGATATSAPASVEQQPVTQAPSGTAGGASTPARPRSFGWVPVPNASYYRVAFFRDGEKIFETWLRRPPLVVPATWTFAGRSRSLTPGEYRWVVRPGFGRRDAGRYGSPIVDARLSIPR